MIVLLGCLLVWTPLQATTLVINGAGQLTGARGVPVSGGLYDVNFIEGSCHDVYGFCDTNNFIFDSEGAAMLAAAALLEFVFVDGPDGLFDLDPSLTYGCESAALCTVLTPFRSGGGLVVHTAAAENFVLNAEDVAIPVRTEPFTSSLGDERLVWAKWNVAAVPEPSSLMLLGIGLLAVLGKSIGTKHLRR
jgi:hypothetical protein